MNSSKQMQDTLSIILTIGIWLATALVLIGGILFLIQHGHETVQIEFMQDYQLTIRKIITDALSLTPLGIIELGILTLVVTQVLRVALLAYFYITIKDYWFTLFSLFILMVLLYSFIWRS